jgi:hypothetical protein
MALKLALESNEGTRWIAMLLGPEPSPEDVPLVKQKGIDEGSKKIEYNIWKEIFVLTTNPFKSIF